MGKQILLDVCAVIVPASDRRNSSSCTSDNVVMEITSASLFWAVCFVSLLSPPPRKDGCDVTSGS